MTSLSAPMHGLVYVRQLSCEEGCPLVRRSTFTQLPVQSPSLVSATYISKHSGSIQLKAGFYLLIQFHMLKMHTWNTQEGERMPESKPSHTFWRRKLKHECYKLQESQPDLAVSSLVLLTNLLGAKLTDTNKCPIIRNISCFLSCGSPQNVINRKPRRKEDFREAEYTINNCSV